MNIIKKENISWNDLLDFTKNCASELPIYLSTSSEARTKEFITNSVFKNFSNIQELIDDADSVIIITTASANRFTIMDLAEARRVTNINKNAPLGYDFNDGFSYGEIEMVFITDTCIVLF